MSNIKNEDRFSFKVPRVVENIKGESGKCLIKQVKSKASLQEFNTKLQELKALCHFFKNTEIEDCPEEDADNLEALEELAEQSEHSQYEGVTSALCDISDDVCRRKNICEEIAIAKASAEQRDYENMIMSCETHLKPRISTYY